MKARNQSQYLFELNNSVRRIIDLIHFARTALLPRKEACLRMPPGRTRSKYLKVIRSRFGIHCVCVAMLLVQMLTDLR